MRGFQPALDLSTYTNTTSTQMGNTTIWVNPLPYRYDLPQLVGRGPLECSSSTVLVRSPEIIFDVNGYYRALGFSAPYRDITRKDLRLAYHEHCGEESVLLTAVLRLLLNPLQRRLYDRAPLGRRHLDEIEAAAIMAETKRRAARASKGTNTLATLRDLLDKQGIRLEEVPPNEQYPEGEDKTSLVGHTGTQPEDPPPWLWSYYRWGTGRADTARLDRWQQMLISRFAASEVKCTFCVGFVGRSRTDSRFVVARTYGTWVIYLREDIEPEIDIAIAAVASVLAA